MSRVLLRGGLICTGSMSAGHHRPVGRKDVLGPLLSVPLWLLLQRRCIDRAEWTVQSRSGSSHTEEDLARVVSSCPATAVC